MLSHTTVPNKDRTNYDLVDLDYNGNWASSNLDLLTVHAQKLVQ